MSTNRRTFLSSLAGAGVAVIACQQTALANSSTNPECSCAPETLEALAREMMAETGEWKQQIRDRRNGRNPMVITRRGCCCCEVTLRNGASHPDWTYTVRQMTREERNSFHEEYGEVAPLLLALRFDEKFEYRGYILNGRKEGWNFSVRTRERQYYPDEIIRAIRDDIKNAGPLREAIQNLNI